MCSYSTKLALFQWQCIKVCNNTLYPVCQNALFKIEGENDESTWLLEKLIGVSPKVIPLGLDEVGRELLAPFCKKI